MKRLSSFLILICFATACKKTVEHKVAVYPNFSYDYDLSTNMAQLKPGDTAYVHARFKLGGSGRTLTLTSRSGSPALHVYLGQDKGIPPFDLTIMLVADDTASDQIASYFLIIKGPDFIDDRLLSADIYQTGPTDTTGDCTALYTGTYKAQLAPNTNSYTVIATSIGNEHNKIMLANIDSMGASVHGDIDCSNGSISIPFQRVGPRKFISGYCSQLQLSYDSYDSTGEKQSHTYNFFKQP